MRCGRTHHSVGKLIASDVLQDYVLQSSFHTSLDVSRHYVPPSSSHTYSSSPPPCIWFRGWDGWEMIQDSQAHPIISHPLHLLTSHHIHASCHHTLSSALELTQVGKWLHSCMIGRCIHCGMGPLIHWYIGRWFSVHALINGCDMLWLIGECMLVSKR